MRLRFLFSPFLILACITANGFQQTPAEIERQQQTNDANASFVNSDSLLIDKGTIYDKVYTLVSKGVKLKDNNSITSWTCLRKIKSFALASDTLIIIKDGCSDTPAFENHQFIVHHDSLVFYRKYKMETTVDGRTNLSEEIYEFHGRTVTQKKRYRTSTGPKDLRFRNVPFKVTQKDGAYDYTKINGWLNGYRSERNKN